MNQLDQLDYYTLLGVGDDAPIAEIKRAFRQFARRYHPDRFAGAAPEKVERASAIYRRGSEALQILTDPIARAAYDAALRQGRLRLTADERDRAVRAAHAPPPKKRPPPIKHPRALALFKEAVRCSRQEDWHGTWRALKAATDLDPDNEFLREKLSQVDERLRTMFL